MYELMLCQNQQLTRNVICRDKHVAYFQSPLRGVTAMAETFIVTASGFLASSKQ